MENSLENQIQPNPKKYTHYLGIDESNHGGNPEVIAAVLSKDPASIIEKDFGKCRRGRNILTEDKNINYRFLLYKRNFFRTFNDQAERAIAFSHLIASFNLEKLDSLIVLLDGVYQSSIKKRMATTLFDVYKLSIPLNNIRYTKDADRKYKIVNNADEIAYRLYSAYQEDGEESLEKQQNHLITPKCRLTTNLIEKILEA